MKSKYWPIIGLLVSLIAHGQDMPSGPGFTGLVYLANFDIPLQRPTEAPDAFATNSVLLSTAASGQESFSGPGGYSSTITFSEYPEGTDVSSSYRDRGVLFGGTGPTIVRDTASLGAQVLSGGTDLMGDITGRFVLPGTDSPAPVYRLGFDIGSIEGVGSVELAFFGASGQLLGSYDAPTGGFFRIGQNGGNEGIYSWSATLVGTEPDGFGIDNVYFSTPGVRDDLDREKGEAPVCEGNPVNPSVGNKYQEEVDYEDSRPFPLRVVRSYNSLDGRWRFFPEIVHDGESVAVQVIRPSGKGLTFLGWGLPGGQQLNASAQNITGDFGAVSGGWVYKSLDDKVEHYDASGRLLSVTNRAGLRHSYIYTADRVTVTHSLGGSLVFQLDAGGRITGFTDPAGETYRYNYDNQGMITTVSYPGGAVRGYHYEDGTHPELLTGISDTNGRRYATWLYDAGRRAVSSSHNGTVDRTQFDYSGVEETFPRVMVTNALGKATEYVYAVVNGQRLPLEVNGQASPRCSAASQYYGYDGRAFVRSQRDWDGNLTEFFRDSKGRELVRTEAVGTSYQRQVETTWHPDFNLPVQIKEPGNTTQYSYDGTGNLVSKRVSDTSAP